MNITMKLLENVACEAKAEGFQLVVEVMTPGLTVPEVIVNKTENGFETIIACDLGAYPFGFILNLTPEIEFEYGTSLMNLFDAVYDKEYSMNWPLMYLERTNDIIPIPLLFKPLPNVDE